MFFAVFGILSQLWLLFVIYESERMFYCLPRGLRLAGASIESLLGIHAGRLNEFHEGTIGYVAHRRYAHTDVHNGLYINARCLAA